MNTITIKIEAPDLVAAITQLAAAANPSRMNSDTPQPQMPAPDPAPIAPPAPVPPVAPTASTRLAMPQPPAPTPAVPTAAPVAGAPTYTLDQISRAGAALVDAGKRELLLALLSRYGVQAVTQLAPEHYGAFATELRALGAQI